MSTVVIMAGGTGGHIYPALAVGTELRARGVTVYWMGVRSGLEDRLARGAGFEFDAIRIQGVWGKGLLRWMTLPLWMLVSLWQSFGVILNRRPDLMLGMGGYVCGPGGLAAALLRCPLIIHESNAIAGVTNRILAVMAVRVLSGVKDSDLGKKAEFTGTPVRAEIVEGADLKPDFDAASSNRLKVLVIGGSQGASIFNRTLPSVLKNQPQDLLPDVMHLTGAGRIDEVGDEYRKANIEAQVHEYTDDMPSAYRWADIAVARAGALTIAELSVMGLAAILVPFPYAARDHQRANAQVLERMGGAIVCAEGEGFEKRMEHELAGLLADRDRVRELSMKIRKSAQPNATAAVVENCMQVIEA